MWKNVELAILIAAGLLASGEGAAWLADPERDDPPPGLGTNHPTFDVIWGGAAREARQTGDIDCFFIGNSMVGKAVDAKAVEQIINREAGEDIHCYNMAAGGVTASEAGLISGIIMDTYDPVLLVYGFSARDLSGFFGRDVSVALLDSAWIQTWLGNPSPVGWLAHHSEAYGQVLGVVGWYKQLSRGWQHNYKEEIPAEERLRVNFAENMWLYELETLDPSENDLAGLGQVLALREQGVTVILVEMPFYPGAMEPLFGEYENYVDRFLSPMDAYAEENDVVFIHSTPFTLLDESDWIDWEHMERSGQQVFSEWLGQQIVDGIEAGEIEIPRR